MTCLVLTIDGPSGAGKGTISRGIARTLGWHYLDSGAIYRALAIAVLQKGLALHDVEAIAQLATHLPLAFDCQAELIVKLDDVDITGQLGLEETARVASTVAAYPTVRAALLQLQHSFQQAPGLVADGRDMGSVVFPQARYKVYLTASAETRALRRYKQLKEKGIDANLIQITQDIAERDAKDSARASAPLIIPEGAHYIDSSDMTLDAVMAEVLSLIHKD